MIKLILTSSVKYFSLQAPRPSAGPHKLRECLPLIVFLRNRLKYALTYDEVKKILKQRLIKVDGKVRTDVTYPAGFMGKIFMFKCFRKEKSESQANKIGQYRDLYIYSMCNWLLLGTNF